MYSWCWQKSEDPEAGLRTTFEKHVKANLPSKTEPLTIFAKGNTTRQGTTFWIGVLLNDVVPKADPIRKQICG